MKINQKKKISKNATRTIAVIAGLIVVAIAIAIFLMSTKPLDNRSTITDIPLPADSLQSDVKNQPSTPINNKTSEEVSASQTGAITITSLDQRDNSVNALAETSNFLSEKCVYSFTIEGGKPIVKEQSGGCTSVSIPQHEFDMIGTYTLTVTAYSGNDKLTTSKEIEVQ